MGVRGAEEIKRILLARAAQFNRDAVAIVTETIQDVERDAKRFAPVEHGHLRSSITREVRTEGASVIGRVGTQMPYAAYLEFGTARIAGGEVKRRFGLSVGHPEWDKPVTSWPAKAATETETPEQMPFLRPALYYQEKNLRRRTGLAIKRMIIGR